MGIMATKRFPLFLFTISAILLNIIFTACQGHSPVPEKHVSPLFVFGDSIFDPGNNNYINTIVKANYYPYGETFFKYPTGRFSDGRIIPDFIAEYAKLPLIPPYLQPGNHEFSYGVNFASAGSGALVESNQGMTIDLGTQFRYFKNVTRELKQKLGDEKAKVLLSRAVYMISIGSNDYVFPFTINSTVLQSYSPPEFVRLVAGNITSVIQEIYKIGGRKFGFVNLWPLACVPYLRVIDVEKYGACFDQITPYIQLHNKEISKLLPKLQNELKGFKYSLLDFYSLIKARMDDPSKYGFKEGTAACCGSGPYRGILSCGGKRGVTEYYLCDNPSEYVFFDSGHLTDRAYEQFSEQAWSGKPSFAGPCNLKALFAFN
ncbi:GDSL esterase/lipase 1 [Morus notabilis]|uniref:GDSL esterase/lipase 1 n=1 Tax=Morus notabilis TaxID=981085 RepID=W9RPE6_9ROSA|nr:GDSL esterase/lipase 1 [Morus notabilis]EXC01345.1 GDSL esterase/lipase 1 [Morus notabilis]